MGLSLKSDRVVVVVSYLRKSDCPLPFSIDTKSSFHHEPALTVHYFQQPPRHNLSCLQALKALNEGVIPAVSRSIDGKNIVSLRIPVLQAQESTIKQSRRSR